MYEVAVNAHFSASHFLKGYKGNCERLHGHNWRIRVTAFCPQLNEEGMVVDFRVLKEKLNNRIRSFDHIHLNELPEFRELNPTTENIARIIYQGLSKDFNKNYISISKVEVWETDGCSAAYWE